MGWFGDALKSAGTAAADGMTGGLASGISGVISGLFGGIGAKKRLKRQVEAQKELNEQAAQLNYEYGEKAAENAYNRQMQMYERSYNDQSYSAMRKQMEDAGLSVGLMYGGSGAGGAGGATTGAPQGETGGAQAGQADSPAAQQAAAIEQAKLGLGLVSMKKDLALKDAQIEEINATAEAKRAEAGLTAEKKITEVQTRQPLIDKFNAEIGDLKAGAAKKNAERDLITTENNLKKIELYIKESVKEDQVEAMRNDCKKAKYEMEQALQQLESMKLDNEIKQRTKEDQIKLYNEKVKNMIAQTILMDKQANMTEEQALYYAQAAYKAYTEAEAIPTEMEVRWNIAELQAQAQTAGSKMASAGQLGAATLTAIGILGGLMLKFPTPTRKIGY